MVIGADSDVQLTVSTMYQIRIKFNNFDFDISKLL